MKLSVIIPVYNVEKYVDVTLESVYSQGVDENGYEVIVVNDGTPDNSMDVVQKYADKHSNLHIITQENQGLSGARNTGLDSAQGEYVWFFDSDDRMPQNGMKTVMQTIAEHPGHDLYGFSILLINTEDGTRKSLPAVSKWYHGNPYDHPITFREMGSNTYGSANRFIYRREWLAENDMHFWRGILHEDMDFIAKAFAKARTMWFTEADIYEYLVRNSDSITSTIKMKSYYDILKITHGFDELSTESKEKKKFFESWMWRMVTIMMQTRLRQSQLKDDDRITHAAFVKENMGYFKQIARRSLPVSISNKEWKDVIKALLLLCTGKIDIR